MSKGTLGKRDGHGRRKRYCLSARKVRYRDGHDAALALTSLRRRRSRAETDGAAHNIRVRRKYWCPACGGWHLTSQPPPGFGLIA
ncbi:MAG: hypothetical protein ACRDV1_02425 [Actinomycetes bacterium]